ncbi:hypothetical protein H310_01991 [Aphanomyces invadans]|uniref:Uncharacterized protein n=1 Tax=Aphanomyces invadans TaxID=157072 RepID=A0A024UNR7_9STRA|nr:hypothetical protein H310_01991 [Aphanomyces invadans]ETW07482.1 hypothetical protein H310_01991 [Aphanomyces invadans]|eukprot:XP_008863575.1 hypothetical protein H310_01991 [Aphanomyces invadans]
MDVASRRSIPSYMRATSSSENRMAHGMMHKRVATSAPPFPSTRPRRWTTVSCPSTATQQDKLPQATVGWRSIPIKPVNDDESTPEATTPVDESNNQDEPQLGSVTSNSASLHVDDLTRLGYEQLAMTKSLQEQVRDLTRKLGPLTLASPSSIPGRHHFPIQSPSKAMENVVLKSALEGENARLRARLHDAEAQLSTQTTTIRQLQADNDDLQSLLQCASKNLSREEDRVIRLKKEIQTLLCTASCNNQHEPSPPSPARDKQNFPPVFG